MTDHDSSNDSGTRSRRTKIKDFSGDAADHPAWLYSVRLQAMATDSAEILDDFDNPFSRQQRANTSPRCPPL